MSYETNPFRLSMLQRSESPFETASPQPEPVSTMTTGPQPPPARVVNRVPAPTYSNPFRVDLSEQPGPPPPPPAPASGPNFLVDSAGGSGMLEPPPYYESEMRRHSDPNITDEKSRLSVDESYREGYERGIRMARERERERQRSRRREREARGERPERTHGDRHRSDRERASSSEPQQSRQRSKSESAGRSSYRSSHRSSSSRKPHSNKPNESLDVIDKMDVTGFYGPGTFHHDGPFDACTPHRNKSSAKRAIPIAAFPADGPNNSLAIENPNITAYRKEEEVYGRQHDQPPEVAQSSFDPHDRAQPVHGQRTFGLGSTTFLDGAPASRDAIEQAGRERSVSFGRSKSLLRRGGSGARKPSPQFVQRQASDPDRDYASTLEEREESQPKTSLLSRVRSLRSSGRH